MERCYSRDPANLKKYPNRQWVNGEPPESIKRRYFKKHSQVEARNLLNGQQRPASPATHQANVAWTPPPIYSAVPGVASTSSPQSPKKDSPEEKPDPYELYRQRSRYDFFVPEPEMNPNHLAMPAEASVGDGFPDISNLW
jgi:hypothetical protein